ncbi:MAG: hypothetical protein V7L23_13170 [Nostoc sp.]|uniref:hypothetical protein n=1 Tax=Nostoc sp. TaxID=1180 RepID=UPI002FF22F79
MLLQYTSLSLRRQVILVGGSLVDEQERQAKTINSYILSEALALQTTGIKSGDITFRKRIGVEGVSTHSFRRTEITEMPLFS